MNGTLVPAGSGTILEAIQLSPSAQRLRTITQDPSSRPLVLVDGVTLDGLYRLADITAMSVASVRLLRGYEAVLYHGSKARDGAIVIETWRGR